MRTALRHAAIALVFTLPLVAKDTSTNTSTKPLAGRVFFASATKVSVKAKEREKTSTVFNLTEDTKVTINGEARTAADLKKGWKVVVSPKADDPATAASVVVTTSSNR
jgi:hypothetical protein